VTPQSLAHARSLEDNRSMTRLGDVYENRVTGELAVVLRGDEDGAGQPGVVHLTVRPHGAVVGEHVHPRMQERFRAISGQLGTRGRASTAR
jgi:hypothetical protein